MQVVLVEVHKEGGGVGTSDMEEKKQLDERHARKAPGAVTHHPRPDSFHSGHTSVFSHTLAIPSATSVFTTCSPKQRGGCGSLVVPRWPTTR